MMIPHRMLSPDALRGVIEAFITREGTDYGLHEVPLATKVAQVRHQLDAGTAVLVYDEATESCTIQPTQQRSEPPGEQGSPVAVRPTPTRVVPAATAPSLVVTSNHTTAGSPWSAIVIATPSLHGLSTTLRHTGSRLSGPTQTCTR